MTPGLEDINLDALLHNYNADVNMPNTPNPEMTSISNSSLRDRLVAARERRTRVNANTTTTKDPIDKYTIPPENKIEVYYSHPTAAFDNIDIDQICNWENRPGGKLLAHPFGHKVRTPELQQEVKRKVFAAIVEIIRSDKVGFYAPKPGTSPLETPAVFLISNLTNAQRQTLLSRDVWSSKSITFRVTTMEPVHLDYLFSIVGFTTQSDEEVWDTVLQVWENCTSQKLLTALQQSLSETARHKADTILKNIINSLRVEMLDTKDPGDASAPTFNIYISASLILDDGF